jgi:hypothetical protein
VVTNLRRAFRRSLIYAVFRDSWETGRESHSLRRSKVERSPSQPNSGATAVTQSPAVARTLKGKQLVPIADERPIRELLSLAGMDELGSLDVRRIAPKPPHDQPVHEELGDVANYAPVNGLRRV